MNIVKELKEKDGNNNVQLNKNCCRKSSPYFVGDDGGGEGAPETYHVYCRFCNTKTVPYDTMAEATFAWNNKILL